ncbi:hypothetical protein Har1130_09825 [Haloarcula sp. CBA1130]|uniref:hypothetical protein n=1 Tax=unclassified Haloarcula TaxID=2624677 RepID=UPI001244F1BB|nr:MULTISPECIES: hypothetical protein [unclassified Haloarcula]KAA9396936.1 hypothetical protein Har1129_01245 [Haloarcula sp. CBA1129]KAA9403026.1 hypothetical protein Har1130_09825 [Haloarcula sp. CBA1130]
MTLDVGMLGYRFTATFFPLGWPSATTRGKNAVLLSGAKQGSKEERRESFGGEKGRSFASLTRGTTEVKA